MVLIVKRRHVHQSRSIRIRSNLKNRRDPVWRHCTRSNTLKSCSTDNTFRGCCKKKREATKSWNVRRQFKSLVRIHYRDPVVFLLHYDDSQHFWPWVGSDWSQVHKTTHTHSLTHTRSEHAHIRETSSMFGKTLHPELKQTRGEMEGGKRAMDERQNISQPVGD